MILHSVSIVRACEIGSIEIENIDPHKSATTATRSFHSRHAFRVRKAWGRDEGMTFSNNFIRLPWKIVRVWFVGASHANLKFDLKLKKTEEGVAIAWLSINHLLDSRINLTSLFVEQSQHCPCPLISCTTCRNIPFCL